MGLKSLLIANDCTEVLSVRYKSVGASKKVKKKSFKLKREEKKKQWKLKNFARKVDPQLKSEVNLIKQILNIYCSFLPEHRAESIFLKIHFIFHIREMLMPHPFLWMTIALACYYCSSYM